MELSLGGLRVQIVPPQGLSPRERAALAGLASQAPGEGPGLRLELCDEPPFDDCAHVSAPAPADVRAHGEGLRVTHALFRAELDARASHARLWRREADGIGLLIALRVALSAALPLRGGLPLHAAGIVLDGCGLACFGPSGAGKTTLARNAQEHGLPVLSDEQVTLLPGPSLRASGFWGALDGRASVHVAPLRALIELARGPVTRLEPLTPEQALRRLLGVLFVPPQPRLWSCALSVLAAFTREVPAWRLAWQPPTPPWDALRAHLTSPSAHA